MTREFEIHTWQENDRWHATITSKEHPSMVHIVAHGSSEALAINAAILELNSVLLSEVI